MMSFRCLSTERAATLAKLHIQAPNNCSVFHQFFHKLPVKVKQVGVTRSFSVGSVTKYQSTGWGVEDKQEQNYEVTYDNVRDYDRPRENRSYGGRSHERGRGGGARARNNAGNFGGSYRGERGGRDRGRGPANKPAWQVRREEEERKPQLKDDLQGGVIYGVAPVLGALQQRRREVYKLYLQEGLTPTKRKDKQALSEAARLAQNNMVEVQSVSKHELNLLTDNRPHQGLVLDASPLELEPLVRLDPVDGDVGVDAPGDVLPVWIALDEVTDPQNLGAILRCAFFLGADGVVLSAKNSAPLSATVSKASAGAMEAMQVYSTDSMHKFLQRCSEGGWHIVGADMTRDAVDCADVHLTKPTVLVMGNEGYGLRTNCSRACDQMIQIGSWAFGGGESDGRVGSVDSLNVSVATGIILHQLLSSRNARV